MILTGSTKAGATYTPPGTITIPAEKPAGRPAGTITTQVLVERSQEQQNLAIVALGGLVIYLLSKHRGKKGWRR